MKTVYDPHTDTITITLAEGSIMESDEDKPGVVLDYDAEGNLVSLEVLNASKRIANTRHMDFGIAV